MTACVDKQVRVWPVKAESVENPLRSHGEGDVVNALGFSADGSTLVWGAAVLFIGSRLRTIIVSVF